jgi:hypothetical protein
MFILAEDAATIPALQSARPGVSWQTIHAKEHK